MPKPVKAKKATTATGKDVINTATPTSVPKAPDWPPLKPLIPSTELQLELVLPHQILTISRFFTSTLCTTYINFLSSLPLTTTPNKPKRGEAVRVNDRFQIQDPAFAKRLWKETGLKELLEHDDSRQLLWKEGELASAN